MNPTRRPGLVSVAMVAALLILALISAGLLRIALSRKADLAMAERRLQADWLAESALDRAASRIQAQPGYTGETWTIPAAELGGRHDGAVSIAVEPIAGRKAVRVRVRADFPSKGDRRARRSLALDIDLPDPDRKGDAPR